MNILTVIYDDQCGLCVAARKWAERRCGETVFFYPASRAGGLMAKRNISPRMLQTGVIVLDQDSAQVGYRGVLRILKRCGFPRWMLSLMAFPGIKLLGILTYRFLARHRRMASRVLMLSPLPVTPSGVCHCGGGCDQ